MTEYSLFDMIEDNNEEKEKQQQVEKSQSAKEMAKIAKKEKNAKASKEKKNSGNDLKEISSVLKVGEVNADTEIRINMDTTPRILGDMFPNLFNEDGSLIAKVSKTEKKNENEESLFSDGEKDKDKKETKENKVDRDSKLNKEAIRIKLAEDFPQFESKDMTQIYLDKKVNAIYAIINPGKKGSAAKESVVESMIPKKIEIEVFKPFVQRAVEVALEERSEIQFDIYYDLEMDKYFLDEPEQERTKFQVIPEANIFLQMKYRFIGSIHSHHYFRPNPSAIDDKSERSFHLYGIFGNFPLNGDQSDLDIEKTYSIDMNFFNSTNVTFRTFLNGEFIQLNFEEVIEC